ncbi:MAG: hypothetical protein IJW05_03370 [Lentisphaeria bacterium]|nr:hypothetical protein [Lentisphaeria bacterium]
MTMKQIIFLTVFALIGGVVFAIQMKQEPAYVAEMDQALPREQEEISRFLQKTAELCKRSDQRILESAFLLNKADRLVLQYEMGQDPVKESVSILKKYKDLLSGEKEIQVLKSNRNLCYLNIPCEEGTLQIHLVRRKGYLRFSKVAVDPK